MSIAKRVAEAVEKMDAGDPEGALFQISSAIDATAKKEFEKAGRRSYKDFIHDNLALITDTAFHGTRILNLHLAFDHPQIEKDSSGTCTIQDILYHAVRCGLYHDSELPSNLRFTDEGQIRADGTTLVLPSAIIYGLICAVVVSPVNGSESVSGPTVMNLGGFPLLLNSLWGKRVELLWLLDVRRQTMEVIQKLPAAESPTRASKAWYADGFVWIELEDGRRVGFPPDKFPRLRDASPDDLAKVRLEARGKALRWEELDEDIAVEGVVAGRWWPK